MCQMYVISLFFGSKLCYSLTKLGSPTNGTFIINSKMPSYLSYLYSLERSTKFSRSHFMWNLEMVWTSILPVSTNEGT